MKKICALTTCIFTTLSLSACCMHDYRNATCTNPQQCEKCGETQGEALGHIWIDATYESPATCTRCGETTGNKLTQIREWGFNNLDEMGNALIEIDAFSVSELGIGEDYVIIDDSWDAIKFENGYAFEWDFEVQGATCIFKNPDYPGEYTIANNDNIIFNIGLSTLSIKERKTTKRENFVVFVTEDEWGNEEWYIPYSLIDWNRVVTCRQLDGESRDALYLIPSIINYD